LLCIHDTSYTRFQSPLSGRAWTNKFHLVVGVAHTNYLMYARAQVPSALCRVVAESLLLHLNRGMNDISSVEHTYPIFAY
jgi:uncharacterized membrane protein